MVNYFSNQHQPAEMGAVESVLSNNEDLSDPHAMQEIPPGYLLWQLIAENTYLHDEDHFAALDELIQSLNLS